MEAWVAWLMGLLRSEHIEFALFAAAFISATVLPGGSEAVLALSLIHISEPTRPY